MPESVLDDGYRNTVEFLRARLRIGAAEARRRLGLADTLLPRQGLAGRPIPPVHPELGAAVAAGEVASRAATVITLALDRVRHSCLPEAAAAMEHALTRTAAENDADFLARVSRSWAEALDQDGAEPSEELLRQLQGAFLRKPRHGLQHLEIFATTDQFEHLITVMNTATNPRTGPTPEGTATGRTGPGDGSAAADAPGPADEPAPAEEDAALPSLDLRSRPQRLLDGLVGACKAALATGGLPAAGGLRPQVMATIDYRDLLTRLGTTPAEAGAAANTAQHGTGTRHGTGIAAVHRPRHRVHHPQNRLRRRHHPGRPRRRGPDPGHRPGLPRLPAPHPQGHHGPGPGLRLPAMHHPGTLVRGPPHHLLVPRRNHRNRQRNPALLPSPPRDP